eukprot:SAG11_NODE_8212_length_1046_cov_1.403379_1_plen_71_part_00
MLLCRLRLWSRRRRGDAGSRPNAAAGYCFAEMKAAGGSAKINKAIEKRRKHAAAKDHKFVPYQRRGGEGD